MFDANAFDEVVKSYGIKLGALAGKLGISESSLRNKRRGRTEFTQTEISNVCAVLGLSNTDRNRIFFA